MFLMMFGMERNDCFVNILDNDNMVLFYFFIIFKLYFIGVFINLCDVIVEYEW